MHGLQHPIQVVARQTGLSLHVIRIWEKRYGAVTPDRTESNRRLYSTEQVERLRLLRQMTQAGQSIGLVAKLPTETLRKMVAEAGPHAASLPKDRPSAALAEGSSPSAEALLADCFAAVKALDAGALERGLRQAELALGGQGMLQRVAAPLAQSVGKAWRDGDITAAHEHFSSAVLRTWLSQASRSFSSGSADPVLLVTTPSGQLHELGALLVAAFAANVGWRVTYLGANLPAAEIAGAARQNQARAVALSLVYPEDDSRLEGELTRLRDLLPQDVLVIVGGRALGAYRDSCKRIGALQTEDLAQLGVLLDELRRPSPSAHAS